MAKKEPKKPKEFNKEEFTAQVNKHLGRLFHNQNVLNDDTKKARIDDAIEFYVERMGKTSSPTQIGAIIYSEYAINNYRGSVAKGISALWNSIYAAYKGIGALPLAFFMGLVVLVFTIASLALIAATIFAFILLAAGGLFYIFIGFVGLSVHVATSLAFTGIGLIIAGVVLLFINYAKLFVTKSLKLISIPIFALSICVRQYARSKRVKYTQNDRALA